MGLKLPIRYCHLLTMQVVVKSSKTNMNIYIFCVIAMAVTIEYKYLSDHTRILRESCKILFHDYPRLCKNILTKYLSDHTRILQESYRILCHDYPRLYKNILTKYLSDHTRILQESCKILCHDLPKIIQEYSYKVLVRSYKNLARIMQDFMP